MFKIDIPLMYLPDHHKDLAAHIMKVYGGKSISYFTGSD
jgi:hypothetical protein